MEFKKELTENEEGCLVRTIEVGTKNDAMVYADEYFTALNENDLLFIAPEYIIKFDTGVYPGVTNLEQYICDKAKAELGLSDILY